MSLGCWGLSLPKHLTPTLHPSKKDERKLKQTHTFQQSQVAISLSEHTRKQALFPLPVCRWCDCRSGSTLLWRGWMKSSSLAQKKKEGPVWGVPPEQSAFNSASSFSEHKVRAIDTGTKTVRQSDVKEHNTESEICGETNELSFRSLFPMRHQWFEQDDWACLFA